MKQSGNPNDMEYEMNDGNNQAFGDSDEDNESDQDQDIYNWLQPTTRRKTNNGEHTTLKRRKPN